jgi:hypothetical protein
MKYQDFRGAIIRGILAGGLTAGLAGGFLTAATVYMNRFDPEHPLLTVIFFFGIGFAFAVVPGIVLGTLVSAAMFYAARRKQPLQDSADVPLQNIWPPAPTVTDGKDINEREF